jgi:hypothetical protein
VVPVHLLTREALAIYVQKLAPGGVLARRREDFGSLTWPGSFRVAANPGPTTAPASCGR